MMGEVAVVVLAYAGAAAVALWWGQAIVAWIDKAPTDEDRAREDWTA